MDRKVERADTKRQQIQETIQYWLRLTHWGRKLPYIHPQGNTGCNISLACYLDIQESLEKTPAETPLPAGSSGNENVE